MPSLNRVIRSGLGTLDADVGATDTRITLRFQHTGLPGGWPDLPIGLRLDVDVAPNSVSRGIVGVASTPVTGTTSTVYHVRLQRALGNAYSKGTAVTPLPLLVSIEPLDDILLRAGTTSTINLGRHFLLSGGQQTDITWSISPANTTQPVGYLSRSGTTVTVHAIAAGNVSIAIGATAPGNSTLRHTATLGVTASNTAPIQSTPFPILSLTDGRQGQAVDGRDYFTDADGDALIVTPTTDDASIAVVAVQAGSGNLIWIISPVALGTTSLEWEADDAHGGTAKATQTVIVGANVAPHVVTPLVPLAVLVNATVPYDVSGTFADANGDALTLVAWTDAQDIAEVVATEPQESVDNADWTLAADIQAGDTTVTLDTSVIRGSGDVDFLRGAFLAAGGRRVVINSASVVWSFNRGDILVTRLTLVTFTTGFPLALARFAPMFLRSVRVNVPADGMFTIRAKGTASTTLLYVQASDGTLTVQDSVGLTVHRPPVWQSIPAQTVAVGQTVIVDLANYAIEPDADPVTFRVRSIPVGVAVHLDGTRLFMRGVVNGVRGTLTVRVVDQYNVSVDTTIAITVTAPASEGPRAPLISRERAHELLRKRGEAMTYTADVDGQSYTFFGVFPSSEITFFTADSGDVAATQATPHVIISDIDFHLLPADVQAELSNANFYAIGPVGNFTIRGVLFQPWLQNVKQDSGHTLWVDINLGASIAAPLAVGTITSEATLVTDLMPESFEFFANSRRDIETDFDGNTDGSFVLPAPDQSVYPTGQFSYYILNSYDAQRVPGPAPAEVIRGRTLADYPSAAAETFALLDRVVTFTDARTRYERTYRLFIRYADAERNIYQDNVIRVRFLTRDGQFFTYFPRPTTPVIPPAVVPTLAAVAATETASIQAGGTVQAFTVAAWYTATDVVPTYALSGAPSWITLVGSTLTIAPAADVAPDDYTATVTASGTGVSDVVVTLTVTVTAVPVVVVPTLVAVAATETATIEAGATAQTVDVSAWYTATDVVPTYALSGAPSWITLSGSTLTIAPASDVAAADYTATVTASGTGVADVPVTVTVTVTAAVIATGPAWNLRQIGRDPFRSMTIGIDSASDGTDLWSVPANWVGTAPATVIKNIRLTIGGIKYTGPVYQVGQVAEHQNFVHGFGVSTVIWSAVADRSIFTPNIPSSVSLSVGNAVELLDASGNVLTDAPTGL